MYDASTHHDITHMELMYVCSQFGMPRLTMVLVVVSLMSRDEVMQSLAWPVQSDFQYLGFHLV